MPSGMSFELSDDQELIRKSVAELCTRFDDHYWLEKDQAHEFPQEFYDAIATGGWLGMTIPRSTAATVSASRRRPCCSRRCPGPARR